MSLLTRVLLLLIASIVLTIVAQVLPPHYGAINDSESALAVGPYGVLEIAGVCLRGALIFPLLKAISLLVPRDSLSKTGAWLLAVGGVFNFVVALEAADLSPRPHTAHGIVHMFFASASLAASAIGAWLVARSLPSSALPRQLLLRLAQLAVAWAAVVLMTIVVPTHVGGLLERIETILLLSWIAVVTLGFRHRLRAGGVERRSSHKHSMKYNQRSLFAIVSVLALVGILGVGLVSMPTMEPQRESRTSEALAADRLFWSTFQGGKYRDIDSVVAALTAAYVHSPTDSLLAAHLGWAHMWQVAERERASNAAATMADHVVLARKYFQRAMMLEPNDARYLGWRAAAMVAEGGIDHDDMLARDGYAMLRTAVKAWPEFNLFTAGYVMSGRPAASPQFKEGLELQWRNMELCAKAAIDRALPDYAPFVVRDTKFGKARACWNSTIAPHNLEGFFLNMGDMLVKAGDWQTAQVIYRNAMASPQFPTWSYQQVLAERIENARANVAEFNSAHPAIKMMSESTFACMACHQE